MLRNSLSIASVFPFSKQILEEIKERFFFSLAPNVGELKFDFATLIDMHCERSPTGHLLLFYFHMFNRVGTYIHEQLCSWLKLKSTSLIESCPSKLEKVSKRFSKILKLDLSYKKSCI